ncbi:hypothetical protein YC2023_066366 [Brassica napus]
MSPNECMICPPAALTSLELSPEQRQNRPFPTSSGLTKLCVAPVSKSTSVSTPPIVRVPIRDPHQNPSHSRFQTMHSIECKQINSEITRDRIKRSRSTVVSGQLIHPWCCGRPALGRLSRVSTTLPLSSLPLRTFTLEMFALAAMERSPRAAASGLALSPAWSSAISDGMIQAATSHTSSHGFPAFTWMVLTTLGTFRSSTRGLASVNLVPLPFSVVSLTRWNRLRLCLKLGFLGQVRLQKSYTFNQLSDGAGGADRTVSSQLRP